MSPAGSRGVPSLLRVTQRREKHPTSSHARLEDRLRPRVVIWHAQEVRERQIDRVVAVAVAVIVVVLIGLVAALGILVGWLPAAILFAAVVLVVFMVLVAN
jgi:fatty acid desaturase